jgi:hypothetical protein
MYQEIDVVPVSLPTAGPGISTLTDPARLTPQKNEHPT